MEQIDFKRTTTPLIFVSFLAVFFVGIFFLSTAILKAPVSDKKISTEGLIEEKASLPDPFQNLRLEARAVYVLDVPTGKVLFAQNEEAQLPLASLTKVMTALVASRIPKNTVIASDTGEQWNVKDLLEYTLMVSSNNGASSLAGVGGAVFSVKEDTGMENMDFFIQKMNEESRALRLAQTFYLNPSGLDVDGALAGAYGSAKDMALLFEHVLKDTPFLMEATTYRSLHFSSLDGVSHSAENTNVIAKTIPGLLASKTGYTDLAGGNLVIAFDAGPAHPVIISVLGSSQGGRFTDVEKLVSASVIKIGQGK